MLHADSKIACLVCEVQDRPKHVLCDTCLDDSKIQLACQSCGVLRELTLEEACQIIENSLQDDVCVSVGMTFVYSDCCPHCARPDQWLSYIVFRAKSTGVQ